MTWTVINTTPYQSVKNTNLLVDTTSQAITVVLPSSPIAGDFVTVGDANDWSTFSLTVAADETIEGSTNDLVITSKGAQFQFIYNGTTWKYYNISRQATKVSDLDQAVSGDVTDDDLFLIVDGTSGDYQSKYINFQNAKGKITEDSYTSIGDVVTDLNGVTEGTLLNVLNFDGENSAYYLDYSNFTNTPTIPTKTSDLSNDGFNANDGQGFITNLDDFDTDDLEEGANNKYFTQARFDEFFDPAFEQNYRLFSGDFDETEVTDSLENVEGSPTTTLSATNILQISTSLIQNFSAGQNLRIYGGAINDSVVTPPVMSSASVTGFTTTTNDTTITYRVAAIDFITGKISAQSSSSNSVDVSFGEFNLENNVRITFSRNSTSEGILVYRSIGGGDYNLVDVLGQNQLGNITSNITYIDYGTFGYTSWSGKNVNTGIYQESTGTVHAPIQSPGSPKLGWVDTSIESVDNETGEIILSNSFLFEPTVYITQNDTPKLQEAIDSRFLSGIRSLVLNDRKYVVSSLRIPDQFSLTGRGRKTLLKKLSWSNEDNLNVIYATGTNNSNISVSNMDIDGNQQNQWLRSNTSLFNNYTVRIIGETIGIDKVQIRNVAGGGIYSPNSQKLSVDLCRVEDSGMNDLLEFSPLDAPGGSDVIVTNNVFKNFTLNIDLSTTTTGVFAGNIVDNCGTGVLIFGSKFFISSPNLIKGPAGEFIPNPDVLNSEFDSVNINLQLDNTYTSPEFVYQENGNLFDLSANRSEISYGVYKLRKLDNVEEEYEEITIGGSSPISNVTGVDINPSEGEFKFSISQSNVNELLTTYSYSSLRGSGSGQDENHVGLTYKANLTEYVPSGNIDSQEIETDDTQYTVNVTEYSNLYVGAKVRLLGHGGSPNLNDLVGTVININDTLATGEDPILIVTIDYGQTISSTGSGGQITVENKFILAKGRIQ